MDKVPRTKLPPGQNPSQNKIPQVNFIRSNINIAAETFCDYAAHNVVWLSKQKGIRNFFCFRDANFASSTNEETFDVTSNRSSE